MFNNDIFRNAYLQQLGLIKEDAEVEVSETDTAEDDGANNEVKQVTFKTSDPAVLDAFNKGFEEVVFFVKSVDEETGEEKIDEVKIGSASFDDFEIADVEEVSEEDAESEIDVDIDTEDAEETDEDDITEEDEDVELEEDVEVEEDADENEEGETDTDDAEETDEDDEEAELETECKAKTKYGPY